MGVFRLILWLAAAGLVASAVFGQSLAPGFRSEVVFEGLDSPTAVRFAPDGRIFVAEQSGILKVFDGIDDSEPDTLEDVLTEKVHHYWDRGLLGLAVDPGFPERPWIYVLYTHDLNLSGEPWGDLCPDPPGGNLDGCVVNGRLSRLEVSAENTLVGGEEVLLEGAWCQQYPSHSIGDLMFGEDGMLYATAGDGAAFHMVDYGQGGGSPGSPVPSNPCADPPGGGDLEPPTAEGGALRAQDLLTGGDPTSLAGALIRIDVSELPVSAPLDNPLVDNEVPDDDLIVAHGLRNPFRIAARPGTSEIWIGDVGWQVWEEIDVVRDPADSVVENFGWPCYEGSYSDLGGGISDTQPEYAASGTDLCNRVHDGVPDPLGGGAFSVVTAPFYSYNHLEKVVNGEECGIFSSSISGMTFYTGGAGYPNRLEGALFFQDAFRNCMWAMLPGSSGAPDPLRRMSLLWDDGVLVDLQIGHDGRIYYVSLVEGRVLAVDFVPDPELTLDGECPGEHSLEIVDASPDSSVQIFVSTEEGELRLPAGPCEGTRLGLAAPRALARLQTDSEGDVLVMPSLPQVACGRFVQVLDTVTCATTEVVPIGGGS